MTLDQITVNTQSSIRMESASIIYFDPLQIDKAAHDADVIFITHDHSDHFSPKDISIIANEGTQLFVPESMYATAVEQSGIEEKQIKAVKPGLFVEVHNGYFFQTVPAYNKIKPYHPKKAGWCGYVLSIDGKKYYIAGDTDDIPEARKVKCDVALVPIGGKFTMNPKSAAELVNAMRPEAVIPTHYGSIVGSIEDGRLFRSMVDDWIKVELKL